MPLRDTCALRDWAANANPSDAQWNVVFRWVPVIDQRSYAFPSTPVASHMLSDPPNRWVRRADLRPLGIAVEIEYLVQPGDGLSDLVDLLSVS